MSPFLHLVCGCSRALLWVVVLQILGSQVVAGNRVDSRVPTSECAQESAEREKLGESDETGGGHLDGLLMATACDICSVLEHLPSNDLELHFPSGESPTHACRPPPLR